MLHEIAVLCSVFEEGRSRVSATSWLLKVRCAECSDGRARILINGVSLWKYSPSHLER